MPTLPSLLLLLFLHRSTTADATSAPPISAIYVFGDSTVDPGNNDYLPATFKADHYPYGLNYPGRVPTGRFSDGLIAPDFMARSLKLKDAIPPYLDPHVTDHDVLTGVSFASGGSGLDDQTLVFTRAMSPTAQIDHFKEAVGRMEGAVGAQKAASIVENAMFLISVGTNDFVINYFDLPTRAMQYSPAEYSNFLLSRLRSVLQSLYDVGARRFAVVGLPPMGCLPIQMSLNSVIPSTHWLQRACVDSQNEDSINHNSKLQSLINDLESQLSDARIAYSDIYYAVQDLINRPHSYGFEETLEGCCGTGDLEVGDLCNGKTPICSNPSAYIFWDSIHPTQAAHHIIADKLLPTYLAKFLQ